MGTRDLFVMITIFIFLIIIGTISAVRNSEIDKVKTERYKLCVEQTKSVECNSILNK